MRLSQLISVNSPLVRVFTAAIKFLPLPVILFAASLDLRAEEKMKMNFTDKDITKIIESYSKFSGQKFIVDPNVHGKVSIFNPKALTRDEAFNQLSIALAINGYGISTRGEVMVVRTARNLERDYIEVGAEVPPMAPEKMFTWVMVPKNVTAEHINRELRMLVSRDGEMSVIPKTNQIFITDWVSNLHRISGMLKEADRPVDPNVAKLVAEGQKSTEESEANHTAKKKEKEKEGKAKNLKEEKVE